MTSAEQKSGLSLRWQICLLTGTMILVSLLSLGTIVFWVTRAAVIDLTLDALAAQTSDATGSIEQVLSVTSADAINVPGFPPIPGIVRTINEGKNDEDGSTTEIWIHRLNQILTAQMKTFAERTMCAVMDRSGKELMRVERTGPRRFLLIEEPDSLNDYSQAEFFTEGMQLPEGQVYITSISLDENDNPALYVASNYREQGQIEAIFVIKLDAEMMLQNATELIGDASNVIVDHDGQFLFSNNPEIRAFQQGVRYQDFFPVRAQAMEKTGQESHAFKAFVSGENRQDGVSVVGIYQKIFLSPNDPTRFWAVSPSIPAEAALEPVSRLAKLFLIIGLIVLCVGMVVTYYASSGLTVAFQNLARVADEIAAGNLEAELPKVRQYGEVGTLTTSLTKMTNNLRKTIAHVSEQDARTNAVLNATADALITIDANGIIQSFNLSAEKLFGYSEEEICGKNVAILAPSPYREQHDAYISRYHRTGETHIIGTERELEGQRKDGSKFPLALRVTKLTHAGEQMFIGTVQDISVRKAAEQERQTIAAAVRDAVNRLATSSHEILATTAQQAAGTHQAASAVTESVATVEELALTADQAAQRADAVAEAARKSEEVGIAGHDAVSRSMVAMQAVKEQVESIAESILALAERAQAIGEITAVVRDIAEQTNVLALNAAVEASRAGEHGKGFAVVAGEVKSLAEQSKKATGQVRQILEEIQQATNNAVLSTEEGTRSVGAAEEVVRQAGDTIGALRQTLADSARSAVQISASANQQAAGVVQLTQGMKRMDQVTKQHAAATSEIELAAQNLNTLSNELASLTSVAKAE